MNLILDMDETLITHKLNPYDIFADPIPRPHLKEFFEFVFKNFKYVSIWTHGSSQWYEIVNKKIFTNFLPEGKSFHFVITRDNTQFTYNDVIKINEILEKKKIIIPCISFLKPLFIIFDKYPDEYNSKNTFILDDKPITYCINTENAFSIRPYVVIDNEDTELLKIIEYIRDKLLI
jgi:hypothetical protein